MGTKVAEANYKLYPKAQKQKHKDKEVLAVDTTKVMKFRTYRIIVDDIFR